MHAHKHKRYNFLGSKIVFQKVSTYTSILMVASKAGSTRSNKSVLRVGLQIALFHLKSEVRNVEWMYVLLEESAIENRVHS